MHELRDKLEPAPAMNKAELSKKRIIGSGFPALGSCDEFENIRSTRPQSIQEPKHSHFLPYLPPLWNVKVQSALVCFWTKSPDSDDNGLLRFF